MSFAPSRKQISEKVAQILSAVVLHPWIRDSFIKMLKLYFRLETEGLENLPQKSSALIIPNHSGFAGLDAIILAHEITEKKRRIPKVMTHFLWFMSKSTAIPANRLGFIEATIENGISLLKKNNLVILFPEGEQGNFKPTTQKYQLQEFKRGFARMAISAQVPIVPCLIIGAEESQINLTQMKMPFFIKKLILPLPVNLIPFPSRWKIVFLPPINLPYKPEAANDNDLVHEISTDLQDKMQSAIMNELKLRKSIYL